MLTFTHSSCTDLAPNLPSNSCRKMLRAIADLRQTLERRYVDTDPRSAELVRITLAEAEALAWETSFPHLVLPLLAEERISHAFANRSAAQHRLAEAA